MQTNDQPLIVDGGFSSAKGKLADKECRIPTCFCEDSMNGDLFHDKKYIVGQDAMSKTGSEYLMNVEDLIYFYPLIVHAVAKKFGVTSAPSVTVGLPYNRWEDEVKKTASGQSNIIAVLKNKLQNFTVGNIDYNFDTVNVAPQGVGAIHAFLADHPETTGSIVLLDCGFNSVITLLMNIESGRIAYSETLYKRGTFDMIQTLLRPSLTKYVKDKTLTPAELNHIAEKRELQIGFNIYNIENEVNTAAQGYAVKLIDYVVKNIEQSQGGGQFKTAVFAGGGARLLKEMGFSHSTLDVHILPNPEMSNAVGFDVLARRALSISQEQPA